MILVRTVALGAICALALAGCSSGSGESTDSTASTASTDKAKAPAAVRTAPAQPTDLPPTDLPPGTSVTEVPGAKDLKVSSSMQKKVTYPDQVSVSITDVKRVKVPDKGPGIIQGQVLAIFTVRFDNGSAKPLDLNRTLVTALYGEHRSAKPTYYADLNDIYGEVAPQGTRSAGYAFAIPVQEYKKVALRIKFGTGYKIAEWVGSLRP
ncbi:MAG: hypothetical protein ABIS86_01965 [Streptosporangiaceae bacterium]